MKKYEFTGKTKVIGDVELKQIKRLSDGLVGGWLESEDNLSHTGNCFVYENSVHAWYEWEIGKGGGAIWWRS